MTTVSAVSSPPQRTISMPAPSPSSASSSDGPSDAPATQQDDTPIIGVRGWNFGGGRDRATPDRLLVRRAAGRARAAPTPSRPDRRRTPTGGRDTGGAG